jgi:hypothetical protein
MTNYKTTIAGIAAGLIPVAQTVYDMIANGKPVNWMLIEIGAALAVLGYLAADAKKEGTK